MLRFAHVGNFSLDMRSSNHTFDYTPSLKFDITPEVSAPVIL